MAINERASSDARHARTGKDAGLYNGTGDLLASMESFQAKATYNNVKYKPIRVHDLRHSHASMLIELGFSPLEIANRLGHEKVETTLNTYAHLYPNKQTKLAERLDSEYREDL